MRTTLKDSVGDSALGQSRCVIVSSVSKTYAPDAKTPVVKALDDVSLEIGDGELVAIVGSNGSGKSTLLKMMYGIIEPDSGSVTTLGLAPANQDKSLRSQATYLGQQQALDPEMTGDEMLDFFSSLYGLCGEEKQSRIADVKSMFGLSDETKRLASTYSGGLGQRLHLAIGMLSESRLLLLDEPHAGLDPQASKSLWKTLETYSRDGKTVVIVSHDLHGVARYANRVVLLQQGKLIADDSPSNLVDCSGQPVVSVTLMKPPRDWSELESDLQAVEGIDELEWKTDSVIVRLRDRSVSDAAILAIFERHGHSVATYRRDADLASAYFYLTGRQLSPPTTQGTGRRKRRRQ